MRAILYLMRIIVVIILIFIVYQFSLKFLHENKILKQIIARLETDSRIAQVMVTSVRHDTQANRDSTTIKFLEYDVQGNPLEPKYFTFSGNIIQFQSLVIRFDDLYIERADRLRGKSVYLFWKVFMLDGKNTESYEISKLNEVPAGYRVGKAKNAFEAALWGKFWEYAMPSNAAKRIGIKNAQIEAPGTRFIPGFVYTIVIEHDGGMRIEAANIPAILRGETLEP
ncbi:MAG: hypothetical protein WCI77_05860 [Candidatus Omnitrophota bacterium]